MSQNIEIYAFDIYSFRRRVVQISLLLSFWKWPFCVCWQGRALKFKNTSRITYVFVAGCLRPTTDEIASIGGFARRGIATGSRRRLWWPQPWRRVLYILDDRRESLRSELTLVIREIVALCPWSQSVSETFEKVFLRGRGRERPPFPHGVGLLHGGVTRGG